MVHWPDDGTHAGGRTFMRTARFFATLVAENGLLWTVGWALSHALRGVLGSLDRKLEAHERRRGLPGLSGAATNRAIWDAYDWERRGEEWTPSA